MDGSQDSLAKEIVRQRELFVQDDQECYENLRLTDALLATMPLGLPSELLATVLQLEYGCSECTLLNVINMQTVLPDILDEIGYFLADETTDRVLHRLSLPTNEYLREFIDTEFPHSSEAHVRNDLSRGMRGSRILQQLRMRKKAHGTVDELLSGEEPSNLFRKRGLSLGGRITTALCSTGTRRFEFLLSQDDVMIALGYSLVIAGFELCGIGDREVVIQISSQEPNDEIESRIKTATKQTISFFPSQPPIAYHWDRLLKW